MLTKKRRQAPYGKVVFFCAPAANGWGRSAAQDSPPGKLPFSPQKNGSSSKWRSSKSILDPETSKPVFFTGLDWIGSSYNQRSRLGINLEIFLVVDTKAIISFERLGFPLPGCHDYLFIKF